MPRKRSTEPGYRYHVSGQAVVTLDGRNFYLGPHDTPESRAKYYALLHVYNSNGLRMPEDVETHKQDQPVTVRCLTAQYRAHAEKKFAGDASRRSKVKNLCTLLEDEYGETPVGEFGPLKLRRVRELLTATTNRRGRHNTRTYVNSQVRDIVRVFKFGVANELVSATVLTALETLEPLPIRRLSNKVAALPNPYRVLTPTRK